MKTRGKKNKKTIEIVDEADLCVIFGINNLMMGRIIAESKQDYVLQHQGNLVIFNANIITKSSGKIWYGDLDITKDFDNLKNVADKLQEDLYILTEHDARWGAENDPIEKLMTKARTIIKCKK